MERDLVNALERRDSQPAALGMASRLQRWRWVAAAATVVVAAAITFHAGAGRWGAGPRKPAEPAAPADAPATAGPAPRAAPPPATRTLEAPNPKSPVGPAKPNRRGGPAAPPKRSLTAAFDEFVPLPGAFALPSFESGRIVRLEVPMTALPAYGIDLVPDATPALVPAEVLIGQDGVPRAIRLAAHSRR